MIVVLILAVLVLAGTALYYRGQATTAEAEAMRLTNELIPGWEATEALRDMGVPLGWAYNLVMDIGQEHPEFVARARAYLVPLYLLIQRGIQATDVEMATYRDDAALIDPPRRLPKYPIIPPYLATVEDVAGVPGMLQAGPVSVEDAARFAETWRAKAAEIGHPSVLGEGVSSEAIEYHKVSGFEDVQPCVPGVASAEALGMTPCFKGWTWSPERDDYQRPLCGNCARPLHPDDGTPIGHRSEDTDEDGVFTTTFSEAVTEWAMRTADSPTEAQLDRLLAEVFPEGGPVAERVKERVTALSRDLAHHPLGESGPEPVAIPEGTTEFIVPAAAQEWARVTSHEALEADYQVIYQGDDGIARAMVLPYRHALATFHAGGGSWFDIMGGPPVEYLLPLALEVGDRLSIKDTGNHWWPFDVAQKVDAHVFRQEGLEHGVRAVARLTPHAPAAHRPVVAQEDLEPDTGTPGREVLVCDVGHRWEVAPVDNPVRGSAPIILVGWPCPTCRLPLRHPGARPNGSDGS